jgi:hypothetical protein
VADRDDALAELTLLVQPNVEPQLTPDELDAILDKHLRAKTWAAETDDVPTVVAYGEKYIPTSRNGHVYIAVQGGTVGSTEPSWPTGVESRISDGGVIWEEYGRDWVNPYDLRAAAYAAWNLKAAKATERTVGISDGRGQASDYTYLNCIRERDKYVSVGIA